MCSDFRGLSDDGLKPFNAFTLQETTSESSRERGPMSGRKDLFDLTGKVAIVTGSTKGIGRAMAEGLAHAGATVVVSSRKQDLCDEVAEQISITTGSEVVGIACHVGDWEQIPYFVDTVRDQLGRIDVLVNNAGINPARTTIEDMPIDLWKKVFNVNLEGPLRTSQLIAPIMRDQGGGSIINIASMGGYSGGAPISPYCASKAALINLTKSMAQAWAPWNVRVNSLAPGPFMSEMVEGAARVSPGFKELIAGGTLQKRIADPTEIVGPVVYLASDASSFVTGDDISASGGMQK
jgi:NAD(P)-dependent dehydrogenase (short-subunit alcohol dehydrogenase family)